MDKHVNVYYFWEVNFSSQNGDELIGTCPFCKHDDTKTGKGHFYVNQKRATFSCKSGNCGKSGSWRDFLEYVYLDRLKKTTKNDLLNLVRDQKIPLPILKQRQIAHDKKRGFLYPIYDEANEVIDIRIYKHGRKEQSVKGIDVGIGNLKNVLQPTEEPIYICESFRDELCLQWLLWRNMENGVVCSTPGSNTFKDEWSKYFDNKDLILCFDHDEAGYGTLDPIKGKATGERKIEARNKNSARSISFVNWPDEYKEEYDVKDFIIENKENPQEALKLFKSFISKRHKNSNETIEEDYHENVALQDIIDKANELYELDENFTNGIKVALATTISVNLPGKVNPWILLVGPSGSGKTEIIRMFERSNRCIWESTLSSKALISGWGLGQNQLDHSILARVNNKCLALKDLTEVLELPEAERKIIFAILRGAFDGLVRKPFGTGVRQYVCLFSLLAGVTHEIYAYPMGALGERFLHYQMKSVVGEEIIQEKALNVQLLGSEKGLELAELTSKFLQNRYDLSGAALVGRVPRWFRDRIKPLARLVAQLRTPVRRHEKGLRWGELVYEPVTEYANRIVQQLEKLAIALSLIEDKLEIDKEIYQIIQKIALDSIATISTKIVVTLLRKDSLSANQIREELKLFTSVNNYMEDLQTLKLIERNGTTGGAKATYHTSKLIQDLWSRAKL